MSRASCPVALITGVSSGIGEAAAQLFIAHGWIVVGTRRGQSRASALKSQLDLQQAEMSEPDDLRRVVATTIRTYGRLDALVCNAGYGLIGPIDSLEYAQMLDQLEVNVLAPAVLAQAAAPQMKLQGSGVIIGVSSIVGRTGLPGYSLYVASKHALEGLYESLYMELRGDGVRVKLVEPSGVNTTFWSGLKRGGRRSWQDAELGGRLAAEPGRSHHGLSADQVAASIFQAATDNSPRLRYPLGQTRAVNLGRRLLPDRWYLQLLRRILQ